MSTLAFLLRCIPGASIYLPNPLGREAEPEIPSAMDDWDEAFKATTGAYPPFSRLGIQKMVDARAQLRYDGHSHGIADGGYEAAKYGERLYQEQQAYDMKCAAVAKRLNLHPGSDPTAILTSILGQRPGTSRKVPPA